MGDVFEPERLCSRAATVKDRQRTMKIVKRCLARQLPTIPQVPPVENQIVKIKLRGLQYCELIRPRKGLTSNNEAGQQAETAWAKRQKRNLCLKTRRSKRSFSGRCG
jgi:hypothetical protein